MFLPNRKALCFNFTGIMVARFFLGLVESIIGPVFVIVTSNWWTRPEQAFRTAFWLSGTPVSPALAGVYVKLTVSRLEISSAESCRTGWGQVRRSLVGFLDCADPRSSQRGCNLENIFPILRLIQPRVFVDSRISYAR
jgi:MFS family permease